MVGRLILDGAGIGTSSPHVALFSGIQAASALLEAGISTSPFQWRALRRLCGVARRFGKPDRRCVCDGTHNDSRESDGL